MHVQAALSGLAATEQQVCALHQTALLVTAETPHHAGVCACQTALSGGLLAAPLQHLLYGRSVQPLPNGPLRYAAGYIPAHMREDRTDASDPPVVAATIPALQARCTSCQAALSGDCWLRAENNTYVQSSPL
jgi:hypothetical protein